MNIVFFGSSDFALPTLQALKAAKMPPLLVVTKPDAPRGRGKKIYPADVRLGAEELDLKVAQPENPNAPEFLDTLRKLDPFVGVVVSYGVILSQELIDLPKKGCINAHASLLPKYRGAAPIEHAIRQGETETGITIMRIVKELDAGDVLLMQKTPIGEREHAGKLRERLAAMSGEAVVEALQRIKAGKDTYTPQDHAKSTRAPKLEKEHGLIQWTKPAADIDLLVRAFTPRPGAQTRLGSRRYIVLDGLVETDNYGLGDPGRILSAGEEGIRVCTGKDLYRIIRIKPENGRNMSAGEFVRGHALSPDARLG